MFRRIRALYFRMLSSKNYTNDLDAILAETDPGAPLHDRLTWLVDLVQWVRYKSYLVDYKEIEDVKLPGVRLRFLVNLLDRNPQWKIRVAESLRSIIIDTRDVELFAETGLPDEMGFWSEFFHRLTVKLMPARPLTEGGVPLFSALFPDPNDLKWFSQLSPELMQSLIDLVLYEVPSDKSFRPVLGDIKEALIILVSQVRSIGVTYQVRRRTQIRVTETPFLELTLELRNLLVALDTSNREEIKRHCDKFYEVLIRCSEVFDQVYDHLDEHGVSLKVVYLLELGQAKIKRVGDIIDLLVDEKPDAKKLNHFICQLIKENQEKHGLWSLFEQNTQLISQKIIERNADKGEHYIAKTRSEFREMLNKAAGGGAYMSLAVIFKALLGLMKLPEFIQGFVYSLNYSIYFVGIQLSGFTLATKQPAMTGPALASKMSQVDEGKSIQVLIDEIVYLIRTQMVGIFGNVGVVIPCIVAIDLVFFSAFDFHLVSSEGIAQELLYSSHLLSFAGVFAAFTGVLLWVSSVFGGYVDNWFHLQNMNQTISYNRRLNYIIGKRSSEQLALFLEKNISGLASNISLAFFLGLVPQILAFLGIFLDVRHVTLAAGNVALGAMYFGVSVFYDVDFWLSFAGLWLIGLLNVGVSFGLAFWVAVKSRKLPDQTRKDIYNGLIGRLRRRPQDFLFPSKG